MLLTDEMSMPEVMGLINSTLFSFLTIFVQIAGSVHVANGENVPWYRTLASFCGPGALVAVG